MVVFLPPRRIFDSGDRYLGKACWVSIARYCATLHIEGSTLFLRSSPTDNEVFDTAGVARAWHGAQ
jgi:hypothetical protein